MAEDPRRRQGARYDGNLAYDLEIPESFPEYPAPAEPEVEKRPAPVPRGRQAFAPGAMLGVLCAGVLLVLMINTHIKIAMISNDIVELEKQIGELKLEQTRLKIAYESVFNLTEVEEYAINVIGMQKPREGQTFYVDSIFPDRAIIHAAAGNPVSDWLGGIYDAIKGLFS